MAALFWGISYVLLEEVFKSVNLATITFVGGAIAILISFVIHKFSAEPITLGPILQNKRILLLFVAMIIFAEAANLVTNIAIRDISAVYAAIGEISYPVFIPLVAWAIFGRSELSTEMIAGGALVIAGAFLLIVSSYSNTADPIKMGSTQKETAAILKTAAAPQAIPIETR